MAAETRTRPNAIDTTKRPNGKQAAAKQPELTPEEQKMVDRMAAQLRMLRDKYSDVEILRVTEWGLKGPKRVVIQCTEPECGAAREIAVQDLFQVRRCVPHQKKHARSKRSTKGKSAEMRQKFEAMKAALIEKGIDPDTLG